MNKPLSNYFYLHQLQGWDEDEALDLGISPSPINNMFI